MPIASPNFTKTDGSEVESSIIREELEAPGWNEDDLRRRGKSHASKVRVATRLRRLISAHQS